jgi:hypothetical protein
VPGYSRAQVEELRSRYGTSCTSAKGSPISTALTNTSFSQVWRGGGYTDKKENKIFLIQKEIQKGAVAKSFKTNGLLIYD